MRKNRHLNQGLKRLPKTLCRFSKNVRPFQFKRASVLIKACVHFILNICSVFNIPENQQIKYNSILLYSQVDKVRLKFHTFRQERTYILAELKKFAHDSRAYRSKFRLGKQQNSFYACHLAVNVGRIVSMPAILRLMSAMVSSYSKSRTVRMPRTINCAPHSRAKSIVRPEYAATFILGSSA